MSKSNLPTLTFIDRDRAEWRVDEEEYKGQPVLVLSVTEEGAIKNKRVVFHKGDAAFISLLINQTEDV